jgi:hypothetical protein
MGPGCVPEDLAYRSKKRHAYTGIDHLRLDVSLPLLDDSGLTVKPARAGFLELTPRALRNSTLFLVVDHRP